MKFNRDLFFTHNFDDVLVNKLGYGLIRISKNASTSVANTYGFEIPENQDNRCLRTVICVLRDPVDRFISSIPETLLRAKYNRITGDLQFCNNILNELMRLQISDPEKVIDGMLDIITQFGFFDAHHAPQALFVERSKIAKNKLVFFNICRLAELEQFMGAGKLVRDNARSSVAVSEKVDALRLLFRSYSYFGADGRLTPPARIISKYSSIKVGYDKSFSYFYRDLRNALTHDQVIRIRKMYSDDYEILGDFL